MKNAVFCIGNVGGILIFFYKILQRLVVEAVVSSVYLLEVIAVVKRCCSSLFVLLPIIYIIMIVISVISLSKCLHLDLQEEAELVNLLPRLLVNSIGRTTAKIYLYANYSY